jgi:hypothetical protein
MCIKFCHATTSQDFFVFADRFAAGMAPGTPLPMVLREPEARRAMLDIFVKDFAIPLEPVTEEQALLAWQAEPLLFKGADFWHPDMR